MCQCIFTILHLHFEKGVTLHLKKKNLNHLHPAKDALCQVWLKMAQWFWRRFLIVLNVFWLFPNFLPFEKDVAIHLNELESPSPKNALCQVWLKLDQWFWIRRFFKVFNVFLLFQNYLPFEKGMVDLYLNELESPSPEDSLCQVWLKLAQWFWRRFLKVVNYVYYFPIISPFGKGVALHLNKLQSSSPRDTLCQVLLKLAQWFWRRRWKCEKFTDGRTDRRRSTGDQKSSLELSAPLSLKRQWIYTND